MIGDAGLVYPEGDIDALTDRLGSLMDSAQLRSRLNAAGRERVIATYSWPVIGAQIAAVYRQVCR